MATGFSFDWNKTKVNQNNTTVRRKEVTQEAVDKYIYDVMSSDQGLAALSSGENLSAGFNSSSKTLMAQDMMTKLIGELAQITAADITEEDKTTRQDEKKSKVGLGTVICTELAEQGLLDPDLYEAGGPASKQVSYLTWVGYHIWAIKVVSWMKKSPALCFFLLPIVQSRYLLLTKAPGIHLLGRATVYIGHPVCNLIGRLVTLRGSYGRNNEFA